MIVKILNNLRETNDISQEKMNNFTEQIEEFGYSCYMSGYEDGINQRSEEIEKYYKGFGYGKKSDNE